MSKDRVPRIKEQHKDNAFEVEKNIPASAELRKEEVEHKEAELAGNFKKMEKWSGGFAKGDDDGQNR